MSKQSATVLEFIAAGRTGNNATSVEFEGFAARGDEGNGLRFFKTGTQAAASQTPIQRGDNSFTDVNGWVYALNNGSVIYYNGSNNWFPNLGDSGIGTYTSTPTSWNIASVNPAPAARVWDFLAEFNEGAELTRGFGVRNSDGNRSISFSRASTRSNINKSGVIDLSEIDKVTISSYGCEIFGSYTNTPLYTSDLSNAVWVKSGSSLSTDTTKTADRSTLSQKITPNSGQAGFLLQNQNFTAGTYYNCSIFAKAGEFDKVTLLAPTAIAGSNQSTEFDLTNGTKIDSGVTSSSIQKLIDGWYRISIVIVASSTVTGSFHFGRVLNGDGSSGLYIDRSQVTEGKTLYPYKETTSAPAASSPDIASIQYENNFPTPGNPFSIKANIMFLDNRDTNYFAWGDENLYLRRNNLGPIQALFKTTSGTFVLTANNIDDSAKDFTFSYDGSNIYLTIDGLLYESKAVTGTPLYLEKERFSIGSYQEGTQHLNSFIKYLGITHE